MRVRLEKNQQVCHDTGTAEQHCTTLCTGCQIP